MLSVIHRVICVQKAPPLRCSTCLLFMIPVTFLRPSLEPRAHTTRLPTSLAQSFHSTPSLTETPLECITRPRSKASVVAQMSRIRSLSQSLFRIGSQHTHVCPSRFSAPIRRPLTQHTFVSTLHPLSYPSRASCRSHGGGKAFGS